MTISRRTFTVSVLSAGLAAGICFTWILPNGQKKNIVLRIEDLFPDAPSVAQIGLHAMKELQGASKETLLSSLFPAQEMDRSPDSKRELLQYLHRKVQRDFAENRLYVVKGWHLSHTETEICALLALSQEKV